jgi:hypothetical protein
MRAFVIFVVAAVLGGFAIGALADLLDLDGTVSTLLIGLWVGILVVMGGSRASRDR